VNYDEESRAKRESAGMLLYDAECGLCRGCVRFLQKWGRRGQRQVDEPWPRPLRERGRRRVCERGRLRFAPLQSELGQAQLHRLGLPTKDFDSMVWVAAPFYWRCARWRADTDPSEVRCYSGEFLLRTDALVAALKCGSGSARVLGALLGLIPRTMRDAAYKAIAHLRHHI